MKSIFRSLLFILLPLTSSAQRTVKAEYSGGHGCVYLEMFLYSDSTYFFRSTTVLMFKNSASEKGFYILGDSTLTLYRVKKIKPGKVVRSQERIFRIRDGEILMYSEAEERSADGDFIKAYNTLSPVTKK